MNKKLLSLAVAGAIAVPMAAPVMVSTASAADEGTGPTVYGRVRLGLQRNEVPGDGNNWGLENDSSRVGIKGTEDLGNGLSVFYRYEFGVATAEDTGSSDVLTRRHAYVGLKGNFGAISAGRQTNGYYALTGSNYALGNSFTGNYLIYEGDFGANSGLSDKQSDSIRWEYTLGDLTVDVDLVLDQDDQAEDLNGVSGAAAYDLGFATVFGGYIQRYNTSTVDSVDALGVETSSDDRFKTQIWTVGASANLTETIAVYGIYEDGDIDNRSIDSEVDGEAVHAGITMDFTDNLDGFFAYDNIEVGDNDRDVFTIGGQYHLSDRTRFYAEAEWSNEDGDNDSDKQIVGIRHDF